MSIQKYLNLATTYNILALGSSFLLLHQPDHLHKRADPSPTYFTDYSSPTTPD